MPLGIVVTDLDGTLLDSRHELSRADRSTLEELGRRGIPRVVATGRSLYSARQVLAPDAPIDFLCHSTGAGILRWADQRPLRVVNMSQPDAAELAGILAARRLDFMLHFAIPDNHHFYVHRVRSDNADFERRHQRYSGYARELRLPLADDQPVAHALVIEPPPEVRLHRELEAALPGFQVIRATSPLDFVSTWVEIYPRGVNKAAAAEWLWAQAGGAGRRLAVGNDFNDVDLLDWADLPFVVGNAPAELRARYANVGSNDASGFSAAVEQALAAG
jgi:hydroxymethylpyrimidine pyrophosphatase-like HAD family hydrolase